EEARTILLGASNSWFPLVMSALSLPPQAQDKLGRLVEEHWKDLKDFPSFEVAKFNTAPSRMPAFVEFSAEQIWAAIEAKRQGGGQDDEDETDLKIAEWQVLTQNPPPGPTRDFRVTRVPPPAGFEQFLE